MDFASIWGILKLCLTHHVGVDLGERLHGLVAAQAAHGGRGGRVAARARPWRRLGAHEGVRAATEHALAAASDERNRFSISWLYSAIHLPSRKVLLYTVGHLFSCSIL